MEDWDSVYFKYDYLNGLLTKADEDITKEYFQKAAIEDAHILEHKLDHKTIAQFTKFVDFMALEKPMIIKRWRESFKSYCDKEEKSQRKIPFNYS